MKNVTIKTVIEAFGLTQGAQVVAIDEKRNYNYGEFVVLYVLDQDEVKSFEVTHQSHPCYYVQKDIINNELRDIANEIYRTKNKVQGNHIGNIVKLARSRKAPNNVELEVVNFYPESYNRHFNQRIPAQVGVLVDGKEVLVSLNTIKEIVKGQSIPTIG